MVGEATPADHHDERDDLAALDFSVAEGPADSVLDALAGYVDDAEPDVPVPVFTVANPTGTVTVTSLMDGCVQRIDLSPKAADMTERDLAAEIVVIAGLATQEAKSAQYSCMLDGMRQQGHDDAATRDFLSRDLGLPTPEQAQAERTRVLATRYPGDHD